MLLRRHLAATLLLLLGAPAYAQIHSPQVTLKKKPPRENIEWLWQYSPSDRDKEGRENDLLQDRRFQPLLARHLTAPQAFWGPQTGDKTAPRKSLAETALDFLAVPGQVLAESNRFLTVTGAVFHVPANRGLLWIDLNAPNRGQEALMAFAAIDWTTENRTPDDPAAAYTLWLFPSQPLSPDPEAPNRIPPALRAALTRWTTTPLPTTHHPQQITTVILLDPEGTPHSLDPKILNLQGTEKQAQP